MDRICGPVVPWPAAARPPIGSAAGGLTDNAVGLTSCERGVGVCLSLRMLENVSRDSCFLQGEFYYADLGGERRLRVVTERMAATSSGREFLLSVDPVVCGCTSRRRPCWTPGGISSQPRPGRGSAWRWSGG